MITQPATPSNIPFDQSAASVAIDQGDSALLKILDRASEYFSLLSEPSRLRIIQSICYEERSVQQVVETTGLPQPNVSRHLSLLHRSGVLSRRRSGTSVFYRVSDDLLTEICRLVCVRLAGKN
jgi:DNA-binding transcriptional ArsR family regulator